MAALLFMTAYKRCAANEQRLDHSARQVRLLKHHEREEARNRRILSRVERFVAKAKALGLERKDWEYYEVNIDEALFFPEARRILSQTSNTASYYFMPIALNIKKDSASESGPGTKAGPSNTNNSKEKKGDISFILKGKFVVRQR